MNQNNTRSLTNKPHRCAKVDMFQKWHIIRENKGDTLMHSHKHVSLLHAYFIPACSYNRDVKSLTRLRCLLPIPHSPVSWLHSIESRLTPACPNGILQETSRFCQSCFNISSKQNWSTVGWTDEVPGKQANNQLLYTGVSRYIKIIIIIKNIRNSNLVQNVIHPDCCIFIYI